MDIVGLGKYDADSVMEIANESFPEGMHPRHPAVVKMLEKRFNFGILESGLAGVILCADRGNDLHMLLLAVRERYRGRGMGSSLIRHVLRQARPYGYAVQTHCRNTSYSLMTPELVAQGGYRIVQDQLIKNFYVKDCGIKEDAHFIRMLPR